MFEANNGSEKSLEIGDALGLALSNPNTDRQNSSHKGTEVTDEDLFMKSTGFGEPKHTTKD